MRKDKSQNPKGKQTLMKISIKIEKEVLKMYRKPFRKEITISSVSHEYKKRAPRKVVN